MRHPRAALRPALLLALAALAAACTAPPRKPDAFYLPPPELPPGKPGDLLRIEPAEGGPDGARAFRLLYRSTGMKGAPVAVSALLVVPDGAAPAGGRDVVAWAHPTTGVVPDCAPSLRVDWRRSIPGLADMVRAGQVVVATDYPGLGTPGVHPYLVGEVEAHAVVDSVRAARNVKEAGAGSRFAVWGHSQGGHAALFTGQLAGRFAPELTLVGVAAAAPATDLDALLEHGLGTRLGNVIASEALWAWSNVYAAPVDALVRPSQVPVVARVAQDCIRNEGEALKAFSTALPLRDGFLDRMPAAVEPWRTLTRENSPGASPVKAPVYVSQGTADSVVRASVTAIHAGVLCGQGTPVRYQVLPGEEHFRIADLTAGDAVAWMSDRFAGKPPPDDCASGKGTR